MSTLASSHVLRGVHVPAPRLPHLRVVGGTERHPRPRPGPGAPAPSVRRSAAAPTRLPTPLRLTRRGRRVLGLALVAGVAVPALSGHLATPAGTPVPGGALSSVEQVAAGGAAAPWSAGSAEAERVAAGLSSPPPGWAVVTVVPGDSLWEIAGRRAARADRRDVVGRIVARNGLVGTEITAGDALLVPTT